MMMYILKNICQNSFKITPKNLKFKLSATKKDLSLQLNLAENMLNAKIVVMIYFKSKSVNLSKCIHTYAKKAGIFVKNGSSIIEYELENCKISYQNYELVNEQNIDGIL